MWSTVQLFSLSLVVSTLYYGGHLVMNNLMSGGDLVAFILYQIELGFALEVRSLLTSPGFVLRAEVYIVVFGVVCCKFMITGSSFASCASDCRGC